MNTKADCCITKDQAEIYNARLKKHKTDRLRAILVGELRRMTSGLGKADDIIQAIEKEFLVFHREDPFEQFPEESG